jgi:dihydrofolate reductase
MKITFTNAIFAIDQNGVMGNKGKLPWGKIPEDMQFFSSQTKNSTLIMGRKTWESPDMIRPLPSRKSIVLTKHPMNMREKYEVMLKDVAFTSNINPDFILSLVGYPPGVSTSSRAYVIGGPEILFHFKDYTRYAYVTRINGEYEGDISIDIEKYLNGFTLIRTRKLCENATVEDYLNETVS